MNNFLKNKKIILLFVQIGKNNLEKYKIFF